MESFKTTYGQIPLLPGDRYHFEIMFLAGCNFKIGVCTNNRNLESAFCDSVDGYGYYSAGQLRNGSKTNGHKYGESFKGTNKQDVIGVYVDLVEGRIFFSKNGEMFPTAFEGLEFLDQEFYPACCCLTKNESFEALMPQPED